MASFTKQHGDFARRMSERQWRVLTSLTMFQFHLTASERSDPELYALIRNGFAICGAATFSGDLPYWRATDVGAALIKRRDADRGDGRPLDPVDPRAALPPLSFPR